MERRKCKRISALLDAEEQVMIENGADLVPSILLNLSAGGALLALKESEPGVEFPAGNAFHLFFDNGGHVLELDTTVVRTEGQKVAFQFSDLNAEQKRAIHTKLIRMAIISARVRGRTTNGENGYFGGSEIRHGENEILVTKDMES